MSWATQMGLLPIMAMMTGMKLSEDVKMEGNLVTELQKLLKKFIPAPSLKIHSKVKATISVEYKTGTNFWQIMDGILERYHLIPVLSVDDQKSVVITLKEGSAWKH